MFLTKKRPLCELTNLAAKKINSAILIKCIHGVCNHNNCFYFLINPLFSVQNRSFVFRELLSFLCNEEEDSANSDSRSKNENEEEKQ